MTTRRNLHCRHFRPAARLEIFVMILALLLLLEVDFSFLPPAKNHGISWRTAAAASPISPLAQDGRRKKKKEKRSRDDDHYDTRVINARPTPPFTVPPAIPGKHYLYFIAMGDWGTGSRAQRHVAELMNAKAGRDSLHFVLLLGDNFYDSGVRSVDDPQWQRKFESMYNLPFLNVPFFASLGNHDHKNPRSPEAQVEYSKRDTKWRMPARYYTFTRRLEPPAAIQFFALDTDVFIERKSRETARAQLDWLENELQKSTATWKVVFGHHPVFSNGDHGDTPEIKRHIRPRLEKYNVDFYLCGHDHDRQLLQAVAGVHYLVSGTGAKSRDTAWADNTIFAASDLGFAWFRVSAETFHVQFINKNGEIEFAHTINQARQKESENTADKED